MASKRKPVHISGSTPGSSGSGSFRSSGLNFRPNIIQDERRGTRPTATPSSIGLILITIIIHICKKSLLFDTRLKSVIYLGIVFVGSLIADNITIPRTYFSRSDNFLNQYFIKWAWGWLLTIAIPWITLTAYTIGCGRRSFLVKHLIRLFIATSAWLLWTNLMLYIEKSYGRCLNQKSPQLQTKANCLKAGMFWSGVDISGHAFIIIYSNLILSEEGTSLIGWEGIKDLIRQEEHTRKTPNESNSGSLRNLCDTDLEFLKKSHEKLTPYLRGLFVLMTLQQICWDVMLVATILYYHNPMEKFLGGIIAILTWYVTYYWFYRLPIFGMVCPGDGLFKYNETREKPCESNSLRSRRNVANKTRPTFMGMPLKTTAREESLERNDSRGKDISNRRY